MHFKFQYEIKNEGGHIACFGVFGNDVGLSAFRDTPLRKDRGNIDSSTKHEWLMITIRSHVKREVVVKALGASEQQRATANQVLTRKEDFAAGGAFVSLVRPSKREGCSHCAVTSRCIRRRSPFFSSSICRDKVESTYLS